MLSPRDLKSAKYVVLEKLGEGRFSSTYKARDTALNRIVVIKVLKDDPKSENIYPHFIHEIQLTARLHHQNIVPIIDIGKMDQKDFLVFEFAEGKNLRDLICKNPELKTNIRLVIQIGMDVCNALGYAHSHHIVHGDLKPQNILITEEGNAKLVDFGVGRILRLRAAKKKASTESDPYTAPELISGGCVDYRSDLYSLGAILYEMVTGRPPFNRENIAESLTNHPIPPNELNSEIPEAMTKCVMKLLEKNPAKRFQSAGNLLRTLNITSNRYLAQSLLQEKSFLSVTIHGAFRPYSAFRLLKSLKKELIRDGYINTRLVSDYPLKSGSELLKTQLIIDGSDMNFFVFTHSGDMSAISLELEYALNRVSTRATCVVFDQIVDGKSSVSSLFYSSLKGSKIRRYYFANRKELYSAAKIAAFSNLKYPSHGEHNKGE